MNGEQPEIRVGDHAPDMVLIDAAGHPAKLADYWMGQPVALVFVRHLG